MSVMKEFFDAVSKGEIGKVLFFLNDNKTWVHAVDDMGLTPLMWAVYNDHLDLAKMLVDHGADVNAVSAKLGSSVIHFAAENGSIEMLDFLLSKSVNLHAKNVSSGATALHHAIMTRRHDLVRRLIALGFDINAKTLMGDSPLQGAIKVNDVEIAKTLLEHGANVDEPGANNLTVMENDSETQQQQGVDPLGAATYMWNKEMIRVICAYKNIDAEKYICKRKVSNIFNHPKLSSLFEKEGIHSYTSGGSSEEAIEIIIELLEKFVKHVGSSLDTLPMNTIIMALKALLESHSPLVSSVLPQDASKLNSSKLVYFTSGFDTHVIYGSRLVMEDKFVYKLYERGFYAKLKKTGKVCSVLKLEVKNKEAERKMMAEFSRLKEENESVATTVLFSDIPALAESEYEPDEQIEQKPFKRGRCYFENLKSLILSEFVRLYGFNEGRLIYKSFDLFMHLTVAREFITYSDSVNDREIIEICFDVVKAKAQKLISVNDQSFFVSNICKDFNLKC